MVVTKGRGGGSMGGMGMEEWERMGKMFKGTKLQLEDK